MLRPKHKAMQVTFGLAIWRCDEYILNFLSLLIISPGLRNTEYRHIQAPSSA